MDRFEDHIELHHLKALMDQFRGHQPTEEMPIEGTYTPGRVIQREAGNVTLGEFKEMLSSIGVVTSESQMEILFAKIDTSADGMVDLNEFFNYMLLHYREKDKIIKREGMKVVGAPSIQHLSKIKQDTIQALVVSDHPLRYISLSKEGYLCSFDHNMELEMTHLIGEDSHDRRAVTNHRRFRSWCTGLAYLGNINMIAVSSSGRDIKFFDVVAQGFVEIFNLYDIQDVPSCLDYWYDVRKPHDESLLLMGGDMGSIHLFYFHKPCKTLFEFDGKTDQRVQQIWMPELSAHHHEYVRHTKLNNIHTEMVRKVKYLPVKDLVISSSGSSKTSVVIADVKGQRRSYVFKRKKGVECFDYSSKLNLLLTGSVDHKVLAWNPYMEHKPMAVLLGHQMAVMCVAINDATGHGYSLSKDGILKVWELHDYHCLQTLLVDFPCLWKQPDFVQASVLLHQDRILVISLRDYLAHLRVGKTEDFVQGMVTTHNTQLCSAIYNPFFQQVATGADDSSISVWDVESGVKSYSITGAHGTEEITCMAFSKTGRKLYTGARNGSIKVWNFQNGHNIHQCEAAADAEVTGLVSLGKKGFLAVGWSRQITFYDDSDSDVTYIKPDADWRGGHLHKDDILSVDHSSPGLLATASFDGEILIWSSETQHRLFRLRGGQSTEEAQRLKTALLFGDTSVMDQPAAVHGTSNPPDLSSRPNSRHFSSYKRPVGFSQAPVDKLLFLHHRIHQGLNDCAVLVSSEAGYLHFWSVYDTQHYKGKFYSSSYPDQSVLALATDPENEMLLSVDTKGLIYIWDIHQYCINSENQVVSYTPPLITSWMSHEAAVVSVEVVSLPYGSFVLSASVDQTARLWTVQGHYVGTFGQDEKWNLRDPATYLHTRNPMVQDEAESEDEEGNSETTHTESQHKESTGSLDDLRGHERDEGPSTRTYLPPPDDGSNKINSPARVDSTIPSESNGTTESATSADRETNGHREEPKLNKRVKASPHVLGQRVETGFANIAETRKQRRDKLLQLENPEELTYGMQCTPFKALITPETAEIDFLSSLPLSTRMQQQGLSINSENDLRKLTFDDNDLNFRMFHKPPKERGSTLHLPKI